MGKLLDGRFAALIDMDGVLYDSMPGHTLAWKRMMESIGVDCSRDEFYLYEGMTGVATINLLFRRAFGHDCDPVRARELYEVKSRFFREMGSAPLMPGADRMLAALGHAGLRRVLVTGSGQASLLQALDRDYPGVFGPDYRVTAHDVTHGKPDPEPYLRGAQKAGVSPAQCIVVENAPLGVRAGKAAGCFTVAVTTGPIPREEFVREGADMIFDSMDEFADYLEYEVSERLDSSHIVESDNLSETLTMIARESGADKIFLLSDSNVRRALPVMPVPETIVKVVEPGESSKSLETAAELWQWLALNGATRRSLLFNVGGGVVTDLGGFVAATFKRGIRFVNVPTSLLAIADAAIGGKTAIDFLGYKNEVGVFAPAWRVVVAHETLRSLPDAELRAGFAEVVKMALIGNEKLYDELRAEGVLYNEALMTRAMRYAARAKQEIVDMDPRERGVRRVLNFGHTAGHAFEQYARAVGDPISHGEAVAHGMLHALRISQERLGFPAHKVDEYKRDILDRWFSPLPFGSEAEAEILRLMAHDKKNRRDGEINYVLLRDVGEPQI